MRGHSVSSQRKFNRHWQSSGERKPTVTITLTLNAVTPLSAGAGAGILHVDRYQLDFSHSKIPSGVISGLLRARVKTENMPITTTANQGLVLYTNVNGSILRQGWANGETSSIRAVGGGAIDDTVALTIYVPSQSSITYTVTDTAPITGTRERFSVGSNSYTIMRPTGDFQYDITYSAGYRLASSGDTPAAASLRNYFYVPALDTSVQTFLESYIGKFKYIIELW